MTSSRIRLARIILRECAIDLLDHGIDVVAVQPEFGLADNKLVLAMRFSRARPDGG